MILHSSRQNVEDSSHSTDNRLDNSMMEKFIVHYQRVLRPVVVKPPPSRTALFFDKKTFLFAERQANSDALAPSPNYFININNDVISRRPLAAGNRRLNRVKTERTNITMTVSISNVNQFTVFSVGRWLIDGKPNTTPDLMAFSGHRQRHQSNGRSISIYRRRRHRSQNVYPLPTSLFLTSLPTAFNLRKGGIYLYLPISCQSLIKRFICCGFQSKLTPRTGRFRFNGQRRYVAVSNRYGLLGKMPPALLQRILTKGGGSKHLIQKISH